MKHWLHRITGGDNALPLASSLFSKGWLSIGWAYLSNPDNLKLIQESWASFETLFPVKYRHRHNLWRFVRSMQPGDLVIVPHPYKFSICKIVDDKVYTAQDLLKEQFVDLEWKDVSLGQDGLLHNGNGAIIDLGFFRKIEVVQKYIPRSYASAALQNRMKIRQTNANISDLGNDVEDARFRFEKNKPLNLKNEILEEASTIVFNKISKIIGCDKFEKLVGWYLESLGARVETPSKNDTPSGEGDADKVAYFDKIDHAIMVQVKKHYSNTKTDDWAVYQIAKYRDNHNFDDFSSTSLWVISSACDFSESAKKKAEELNVRLIDGNEFARMILENGIYSLDI